LEKRLRRAANDLIKALAMRKLCGRGESKNNSDESDSE
jgi:hypothetical protein